MKIQRRTSVYRRIRVLVWILFAAGVFAVAVFPFDNRNLTLVLVGESSDEYEIRLDNTDIANHSYQILKLR